MSEPIKDYGLDAAGNRIERGTFCIDPSGHLIVVPKGQPLKAGWRYATEDNAVDAFAPPPALDAADEPVEAFVESIDIDAPIADPRD